MRSARGQGTIEYLAVVLVVALVVGGGTAAAANGAGADLATAVPHQMVRALCIVAGGDCDRDRAPCDVVSSSRTSGWAGTVAVFRIGHGEVLLRVDRSDGSIAVTRTTDWSGGFETIDGARLRIGGRRIIGAGVTASILGAFAHGKTWVLTSDRAARALIADLRTDAAVRPPDQDLRQVGAAAEVSASRSGGSRVVATGTAGLSVAGAIGEQTDHATGERMYFLDAGADAVLDASVSLQALPLRASGSATAGGLARIAVTVDRAGRWTDLAIVGTGEVVGAIALPDGSDPMARALGSPAGAGVGVGRRWVAEAHLDLHDPANLAAARRLVDDVTAVPPRPVASGAAARDLARRIDDRAVIDVRTFALAGTDNGFDARVGDGAGFGLSHDSSTEHAKLIAAATRGLDGRWRRRQDCLQEVLG